MSTLKFKTNLETKPDLIDKELAKKLDELANSRPHWKVLESSNHSEDVHLLYLNWKVKQIDELEKSVKGYSNEKKHFTRLYRTLEGDCGSLLIELDRINHSGREDLQKLRKEALTRVNDLIENLKRKVHADGRVCDDCEVQK